MKIGDKVKVNKNIGEIIKIQDNYGLIKFKSGQFVFNLNNLKAI